MTWYTLLIRAQNLSFLWYDAVYLSENGVKFVFLWYDMAYLNDYSTKFVFL